MPRRGSGKSWFSLHLAAQLAQQLASADGYVGRRPRIPLLISLRDYSNRASVASMLSHFFFHEHRMLPGGWKMFELLNRMGRLLIIFDGFDEMAARMSLNEAKNVHLELSTVIAPSSKVIVTCRSEFFSSDVEAHEVLGDRLTRAPPRAGRGLAAGRFRGRRDS